MLEPNKPAVILAPMEGITDAPMRALQGELGSFSFCVSEFVRVAWNPIPAKAFLLEVPELAHGAVTPTGLPVAVQILGGDPDLMANSALEAIAAGAKVIDINFGCPAKTVNRNDGGATLLKAPERIRDIVRAVRSAVPSEVPVSAKMRLGWEDIGDIHVNSQMAAEGGASWLTVHSRTRMQGYLPPVYWLPVGAVRRNLSIPVVVNGDIWNRDEFQLCQEQTGCIHFMLGRSALANPNTPRLIASELGLPFGTLWDGNWEPMLRRLLYWTEQYRGRVTDRSLMRLKQWLNLASKHGDFAHFDAIKRLESTEALFDSLQSL